MTTLQSLLILTGFAVVLFTLYTKAAIFAKLLVRCLKGALLLKIGFFVVLILVLPFHKNGWSTALLHLKIRYVVDLAYAGGFAAYCLSRLLFPARIRHFKMILFDQTGVFYRLLRLSASSTFLFSAVAAIFFFDQSLAFFTSCGYNRDFMIFIIGLEMICGVLMLFSKTAGYAALLLIADMAGAVFTHYHNYFQKHFPNPFGNSVPALITLTLLVTIVYLNAEVKKAISGQIPEAG